jgi:hypothetical protein
MMMFTTILALSTALVTAASGQPFFGPHQSASCGDIDVIFTGLPPYHPLVESQGFNPTEVDAGLRADAEAVVAAGYNLRVVLMGPEVPITVLENQIRNGSHVWDGTGIGYGVRGSHLVNLTSRFTDIVGLYRHEAPFAPMVFDYSFTTAKWAIEKQWPLAENCTETPGVDLVSFGSTTLAQFVPRP